MFGLFGSGKSFEDEMAEYASEARRIGHKYGMDKDAGMSMIIGAMTDPTMMKKFNQEQEALFAKRIACCKKHRKGDELRKWQELLAKQRELFGGF